MFILYLELDIYKLKYVTHISTVIVIFDDFYVYKTFLNNVKG